MRKIMLTSSGFESKRLIEVFHGLFEKKPAQIRALFVPTAANDVDAIAVLPKCMNDLLFAGILSENITVFDLHRDMPIEELHNYDIVYFTGGSPQYLLERINGTGFNKSLASFLDLGGVYVGVSAGSWVATNNLPNSLGYINCTLSVHMKVGTKSGPIDISKNPHIDLTGNNAILILGTEYSVIE